MTNKELEKIYNEAYRSVYWTAMSLLKNEDDAEDIVQETFITLIKSYDTIQDKSKVHAWLKKTAANKCLDRIKLTKTVNVEDEFFEMTENVPEDFLPDSLVESAETRKIIMGIIDNSLSEGVRRTIILYYFDDLSVKEISQLLDVPQGTVLWRLSFARKKIKKEVEKYEKDNDTKLFALGMPFLTKLFMKEAEQLPIKPMSASLTLMTASADGYAASAAEAGIEIASQTAAQTGAALAADTGKKVASEATKKGMSAMMKKIIISGIAVILTGTAVAGAIMLAKPKKEEKKKKSQTKITTVSEEDNSVVIGPAVVPDSDDSKEVSTESDIVDQMVPASSSADTEATDTYGQIYSTPTNKKNEYVVFGRYEQDVNDANGPEPIEWIILDEKDGKLLLISRYLLELKKYNEEDTAVSWETCTLRAWLNNDFLNTAFSSEEQAAISETTVINGIEPSTGEDCGNDTVDKVFLLSVTECMQYFGVDPYGAEDYAFAPLEDRQAISKPTRSAATNGVAPYWWGRSSAVDSNEAQEVDQWGFVSIDVSVTFEYRGARPVIWVEKDAVNYTIDDGKVHVNVSDVDFKTDPYLIGTWTNEGKKKTESYIFNADNTFTCIITEDGETEEESGLYTIDGQWILMIPDDDEAGYLYYSFEDGDLRLQNDSRTLYLILKREV